jgi:hypothetical protein
MKYLRTTRATDWSEKTPWQVRLLRCLLFFIPEANPGYEKKMYLIKEWYVEFENDGTPYREIAIDAEGKPLFAGPSEENYGFWLDTNMTYPDFGGDPIEESEFERVWEASVMTSQKH